MKTIHFLLIILASNCSLGCRGTNNPNPESTVLAETILSTFITDLKNSEYFMKGEIDTAFLICHAGIIVQFGNSNYDLVECTNLDTVIKSISIQSIASDSIFRTEFLLGKIDFLKQYFFELDTIVINSDHVSTHITFGSLSNRITYLYEFDPTGQRVLEKEFQRVVIE